jgi:hypothetical protein
MQNVCKPILNYTVEQNCFKLRLCLEKIMLSTDVNGINNVFLNAMLQTVKATPVQFLNPQLSKGFQKNNLFLS